tara:strand:- start:483 stop:1580 length:1098 start_codon:yes stop_codon:yes gene_type:complete
MIKKFEISLDNLIIHFTDNNAEIFPNIWLRDHAKDEKNWDKRTNQRKTFTAGLDLNLKIKNAKIIENGKFLSISWPDLDSPVNYSFEFLYGNKIKNRKANICYRTWKNQDLSTNLFFDFDDTKTKEGFKNFLTALYEYGFVVLKNCDKNFTSIKEIANKIGYIRNSIFGGLWSFESDQNKADTSYTQDELRPHTDGTYSNDAPGLQLLLCTEYSAEGGESILVDGFKIAEKIKKENNEMFELLSSVNVTGNYIGDGVFLKAERPIFRINKKNEIIQVSFNNYDRAIFRFENDLTKKFYAGIKKFDLIANDKEFQWRHILKPGELLIFNNWRILHGRGSFDGIRKMSGCYINKEDFDSSCIINGIT